MHVLVLRFLCLEATIEAEKVSIFRAFLVKNVGYIKKVLYGPWLNSMFVTRITQRYWRIG
jgi:hypothetical protein